eukprot:TRINITY_DN8700_c0_g2_i1.p1 TRINITY_DN8700_c0_g2~~TRINITY_DN8700_c0_g2_i1.p1  ORF type:complete len:247 (-),score=65.57 TRINITY_DN8700_c0_g2_i1:18-758(-)
MMDQFGSMPVEGGRVVFCTHGSLDYGLGYCLLRRFIEDPNALFIFPFTPPLKSLASKLLSMQPLEPIDFPLVNWTKIASPKKQPEATVPVAVRQPIPQVKRKTSAGRPERSMFKNRAFFCFDDGKVKKKIDAFGDVITEEEKAEWKRLNPGEAAAAPMQDISKSAEDNKTIIVRLRKPQYSGHYEHSHRSIQLIPRARFRHINFDGIYDMLSLRLAVKFLKPKRLILFNANHMSQALAKVIAILKQ